MLESSIIHYSLSKKSSSTSAGEVKEIDKRRQRYICIKSVSTFTGEVKEIGKRRQRHYFHKNVPLQCR